MLVGELKDPAWKVWSSQRSPRAAGHEHARVFVSVDGTEEEQTGAIKALEHAAGYIRRELIERLQVAPRPGAAFHSGSFPGKSSAHRATPERSKETQSASANLIRSPN